MGGDRDSAESDSASRKNSQSKFFVPNPDGDKAAAVKEEGDPKKEETTAAEQGGVL